MTAKRKEIARYVAWCIVILASLVRLFALTAYFTNTFKGAHSKGKDEDTDEEIFEVDCIVDVKWAKHKHGAEKGTKPEHLFRTRWKGYGESEDTWEPLSHLKGDEISENSFSFLISPDDAQAHALQIFFR